MKQTVDLFQQLQKVIASAEDTRLFYQSSIAATQSINLHSQLFLLDVVTDASSAVDGYYSSNFICITLHVVL